MELSINYSPQAAELFQDDQIKLDRFKTPPWPDMIAEAEMLRPVSVHFNLRAGSLEEPDYGAIESFLATTSTKYINTHLGIKIDELLHIPPNERPNDNQYKEVFDRLMNGVKILTDHFGPERVIAENIPFRTDENTELMACAEPKLISQIIQETGCGLLLDVSHARIAAHYFGMDAQTYIEALPLHNLKEIHFTGIHNWDGYLMDHLPILDADWPWLDWVLDNIEIGKWGNAHMLAFEYGGVGEFFQRFSDPQVMAAQVPRLYEVCHNWA